MLSCSLVDSATNVYQIGPRFSGGGGEGGRLGSFHYHSSLPRALQRFAHEDFNFQFLAQRDCLLDGDMES